MLEVKIFLDIEDMHGTTPLYEHIMRYLLHHGVRGATLFRGVMGFGKHHHLNEPSRIAASDAVPAMIVCLDEEERLRHLFPHLREVLHGGLIVVHQVEQV